MSESTKTIAFVAIAAVVLLWAWFVQPDDAGVAINEAELQLFGAFDPKVATNLKIDKFDDATGRTKSFEVKKVDQVWSIPSHQNYPADAERQLGEAAASIYKIEMLGQVSTSPEDHELYGVVDPAKATQGAEGVGMSVSLKEGDKVLADLIVGKEVEGETDVRYVRKPNQDLVYRAKVETSKLSTRFEDWIEADLLKLNSFDIKEVVLNNYSIDVSQGTITRPDAIRLSYDDKDSKWSMEGLPEGQELDTAKINEMKTALDDLKIVDVRRKPEGLSTGLKQEEGIQIGPEERFNLEQKGFFLVQGELLSNEGEAVCRMKDGVTYLLRFGGLALNTGSIDEEAEDTKGEVDEEKKPGGSNRYIFVSCHFDPDVIPKPELETPPAALPAPDAEKTSATETSDAADADAEADEAQDEPQKKEPAAGDAQPPAAETAKPAAEAQKPAADAQPAAADAQKPGDSTAKPDDAKQETKPDDKQPDPKELERKRKEVERENKRKMDEYDEKIKNGEKRVKELNDRFADWYYVISDEVYQKIHLTRATVVKAKEPSADGAAPGARSDDTSLEAFEQIKQRGLPEVKTPPAPEVPQTPQP